MYKLLVISFFGLIGNSLGQILQNGQCNPNVPLADNFVLEEFLGTWYEIARTDSPAGGDCSSIEFTRVGDAITVIHKTVTENFYKEYSGGVSVAVGTPRLVLNLPMLSSNPIDFWVLSTDTSIGYALTYGCENVGTTQRRVYLWQLNRTPSPFSSVIQSSMNTLIANLFNINSDQLRGVSHSEQACYLLPNIEAGQPVILPGQCDQNIKGVADFRASEFLGVWHQIQSYYSESASGGCNRAQYSDGGDRVIVRNTEIVNQRLLAIEGYATATSPDNTGLLDVVLEVTPGVFAEMELLVLGTDYNQWAVSYTCENLPNNSKRVFSWVVSRTRQLTPEAQQQVNQVINSYVELNNQYYQTTDQSDAGCFYIPDGVSGEPLVFGGQCDLNIPVVDNFNAELYMGQWHEIERYPTPFQFGTCNNAYYTLGDGIVEVFNTQVQDQKRLTIIGKAEPVANGKLVVSFPVEGTEETTNTDYWVLGTDYSSYSFVYSCRNINDYQQQVTFWKLSRTKQLSQANQATITNIINSLGPIANQQYITTDQSVQGCFYYPEPQEGVPVQFPGTCESEIPVVLNFDAAQFSGEWFEVEAYPKDPQEGHCINHQFSLSSGTATLDFSSNYVNEQLSGSTNGQLTLYAGQTGGRLTLSFLSNNQLISFPYYVVATDYISYALVYSCQNIEEIDHRGIWAWKLSRTKQLSPQATAVIDDFLDNTRISVVLSNNYFEPIQQTDYACFSFPELAPGAPVLIDGQCQNVPTMQNFEVSRYLKRWRLIESYPDGNKLGQCNQVTFFLGSSSTIDVYINEVVSQALREINGNARVTSDGKFDITIPGTSESYEFWILDTDYETYSLAYSCVNVGATSRRIQSWKFSTTTSLTPAAVTAIDAVINRVDVLNNRYYVSDSQTDNACFYYPTPGIGPTIFRGQCDLTIPVVTNFRAADYMGVWHDIASYRIPFQDGSCPNARYNLNAELARVDVFNTQVLPPSTLDTITGYATVDPSVDDSAKLQVTFPTVGGSSTPYWVLSTDYISYALVYSCTNVDTERRAVSSWKLSRAKSLTQNANSIIEGIINTIPVLDNRYYVERDQSPEGCFYFPEPQTGVPVEFPGRCENIPVVTDFDMEKFSGTWHEIEAYPKVEQTGDCINHQFTVSGNRFDLRSSNVIAQSLGVTEGTVQFTGNNNEAKMTISIVSNGQTIEIPYWIVDTDYDNYAVAYSCVNIDNDIRGDYRGVWSWKLSRTKELRAQDSVAINSAIANIDVLDNRYYNRIGQSNEACFYYPEIGTGQVIFPGQCADIQAMPNFNAAEYLGKWRTIASYPSNFQLGTCGDATYSLGQDAVDVYNTEVVDGRLSTINGTARAAADGSGKLYVTFPDVPNVAEYLVLDTDYRTYSIVYSCTNRGTDERIIHSWKLSRTNSLPDAAVEAIKNVVDSIDVLEDRYYKLEERTPSDCFYYPEPNGSPVRFRGQCDNSIPVQANFNAVEYMGTWFSIESYPSLFQGGTCGSADYVLEGEGVRVTNKQVIDQTQEVQTGTATVVDNAKLSVTFDINGEDGPATDYWILSTDYNTYSLVYSCKNIDNEYKQVNSWKLSRTKDMTAAATTLINNVIAGIPVLDQQYYDVEGHTDANCFFYPDNNGGDVVLPGQCAADSDVPAITSFNANRFSGTWHEAARFPSDLQKGECAAATFSVGAQNSLTITQTIVDEEAQSTGTIPGTVATDGRGVITATADGVPFNALYILDTDYDNYALVYACRNLANNEKQIYSWKLSRTRAGLSSAAEAIISNLVANNIDLAEKYYKPTLQTGGACFHYPDYTEGLPDIIELEGTCDERIAGVSNFNAAAYLGLWREIARFPDPNQFGKCGRAYYSLGDNQVDVRNTQVVEEALLEQLGSATASTDGTGQLSVDFVVNGVEVNANYYILATDYESYSLVYSCRNTIDSDGHPKRLVTSWKLSRTNSLSAAAQTAMNQVIEQTQGLDQRYYESTDQSDEACFYVPEPNPEKAPLFRGRCETLTGIANFNDASFAGWWHELEHYPRDSNVGDCISSQYSVSGGSYQVVDTAVTNGIAEVVEGTATVANGVLTRVLSNGVTQQVVVLDTDYNNYALLYSCEDVTVNDEEYRRVWSAKHSKTRDLSSVNVAALDTIIESNNLLHSQLYKTVEQSDNACFHYPEVQGQRVILPGQCDLTIPVVQNFDIPAYGGTWYQIERYPQVHEDPSSTCIGARYTLDTENSIVNVVNWEVIDGELETIEGTATASADGSARLTVTLPVVGTNLTVTTPLYVLATDYNDYSLAYSCANINPFQRSIGVWKLSRERTLSSAGATAINTVINSRVELDPRYFLSINHNDECPEPSSSGALVHSSLLVILVCFLIHMY